MRPPIAFLALLAQIASIAVAIGVFKLGQVFAIVFPLWAMLCLQASLAVGISLKLKLPSWWLAIQAIFVPALVFSYSFKLNPSVYLVAFIVMWLFFRSNTQERVPLYLSNLTTYEHVLSLLPAQQNLKFIDLGSGLGGMLGFLAQKRTDCFFYGVESAPAPYAISWLRTIKLPNVTLRYKSFWQENLAAYDVVYVFLSPEPMPALWQKAKTEMHPGSLLISNSFIIPDQPPNQTLVLADARQTKLFIWQI
ncbi:MAG: class I SAM-dependent methyltransferase [Methylococcaceae bacterium]|jgi:hypothetical protein